MTDREHRSRSSHSDHDGHDGGKAPGKERRSDVGAAAAEGAAAAAADPLAELKTALNAGDGAAALAAWDKIPAAQQKKTDKNTLLLTLQVIGPKAARVLKEAGSRPSADPRFCKEILHNHPTAEWIAELQGANLLRDFLKAAPRRERLDKPGLERLADFAGTGAPSASLAKAAYEKAWGPAKNGKLNAGGWTALGQSWDRDHLGRMYRALLTGGIPPAHLHNLVGMYIAKQYIENDTGKKQNLNFGYFINNTIVMPLYKGDGITDHDMVGADESEGPSMGHFQSTALHEVGHLVGDQTGEHDWGTTTASPLHMETATDDEVKKELWDNAKSEKLKGKGGKKADPVSAADAKLYLEAEVRGEAASAFSSTAWAAAGKSPDQFRKNVTAQYSEQPLYKMAKAVRGDVGNAYREAERGTQHKSKVFAYLTRFQGGWAKYNKEALDNKVSWYSLSSAAEWFAEQYQYYMSTGGDATIPTVKTKFKKIMKELDDKAPGKKPPAIRGPRKGGDGGGASEHLGKDAEGGGGGEGGGSQTAAKSGTKKSAHSSEIHRFQIDW